MKIRILLAAVLSLATGAVAAETSLLKLPIDHPLVSGALSKDTIRQVVHLHASEVRECYQAERKIKPGIGGRVIASFLIDVTGAVSHAQILQTTLKNSNVENCMINRMTRWHFPRPDHGEVKVTYPFMLSAHS
jgi:outer membrane biosynthesis protein TonB